MGGPNQNESRMSAVTAGRKFLAVDTGDLVFLNVPGIVNNFVDAGLFADFSGAEFITNACCHISPLEGKRIRSAVIVRSGFHFGNSSKVGRDIGEDSWK